MTPELHISFALTIGSCNSTQTIKFTDILDENGINGCWRAVYMWCCIFIVSGEISSFHICYCSRCRHSTGSVHASNIFTSPENIIWITGKESIQRFKLETAKSWAKQFCKICGSGVPYINRAGTHLVIPAGSLNSEIELEPDDKIFCDSRPKWIESIAVKPEFALYPDKF